MLRHTLATLAYRAAKALRGAPPKFAAFKHGAEYISEVEIVAQLDGMGPA